MTISIKNWQSLNPNLFKRFTQKIEDELGLRFNGQWNEIEKRLEQAYRPKDARAAEQILNQLLEAPLTSRPELIALLTTSETYFLRNQKLFEVLETIILPEIIARKAESDRTISVWSAGCSSGEEPYSVAILLHKLLHDSPGWNIKILGSDLNEKILQKAKKAVYSEWSFRNTSPGFKERYFTVVEGRYFKLKDEIKKYVTFVRHNLQTDPIPPHPKFQSFDLIFCRNVLMYFAPKNVPPILERLYRVLDDQGYFITGPGELPSLTFKKFKPQIINNIIVYRKQSIEQKVKSTRIKTPAPSNTKVKIKRPSKRTLAALQKQVPVIEKKKRETDELTVIRNLANNGQLQEACQLAERYVARNNLDAYGHYLLGTIYFELGELEKARKCFEKALYLKPDFIMAHFNLANIFSVAQKVKESQRFYKNVLKLLNKMTEEQEIPEGDGIIAAQFKDMVQQILSEKQVVG